jgi:nitroreductase
MNVDPQHIPYQPLEVNGPPEALAQHLAQTLARRRSVRFFSTQPVSEAVIQQLVAAAATAPSGANKQPWTFCAVSNPELKRRIRQAAEEEEKAFYAGRAGEEWLRDLAPLGTDWNKPFLEDAPWLIVVFKQVVDPADGTKRKNYYVQESVGIACGMLITAIHLAGLVTLTHTPSPMDFLSTLLNRPPHEKPFLLLPVGYPAEGATVPNIHRKPLDQVLVTYP